MSDATSPRHIPDRLQSNAARLLKSWEVLLLGVAILIFIANSFASPYFLNAWNLSDATFNFTEKAMIAFAMALLIISGEIDLSVASIIALASTAMGAAAQVGAGTTELVLIGLVVGLAAGAFNGVLVTVMGLPSIVVTIGTMSLFRGISYIILGDGAYRGYPSDFAFFGQGYVWWVFSFEFLLFAVLAVIYYVVLHRTEFRPHDLYHRQQRHRGVLLGYPGGAGEVHPVPAHGPHGRGRGDLPDLTTGLHTPLDRVRLGA